ncbi:hypothetical protein [Thalassoroseus pseudoceratinae]|uniref:hypothetical protein n=1 Tax=Thalassoroseus pseudoceratinae TaxID=2713176 RepID=UPI001421C290|nr:hypothetical protein [Thalassoroseus pseudoceratinae]
MLRLTLRTLLAYLDDVLEPPEAKALGAKIAELKVASDLMNRIKSVMRRRRLIAPPVGPDANMVSDYLDNTLSPQAVNEVEAKCLESDVHLAEVAACHQIMTQLRAEPKPVENASKEHLYSLIPGMSPSADEAPVAAASSTRQPIPGHAGVASNETSRASGQPQAATHSAAGHATAPVSHLPKQLQPAPFWKRALVPAGLVAVVLGWLLLIVYDPSFNNTTTEPEEIAQNDTLTKLPDEQAITTPEVTKPKSTENEVVDTTETPALTETGENIPMNPAPPGDAETVPKIDVPNPGEIAATPGQPTVPTEDTEGDTVVVETKPPATAAEPAPKAEPPALKSPEMVYDSAKGVLLAFDPQENDWSTVASDTPLKADQQLISPIPFVTSIRVANGRYRIELEGGTFAQLLAPTDQTAMGVRLRRGVVSLERPSESADPQTIAIHVRRSVLIVQLLDPGSRCLFHLVPREPSAPNQVLDSDDWEGLFRVQAGRVAVNSIGMAALEVEGGQDMRVDPLLVPMAGGDANDDSKPIAVTFRPLDRIPERLSISRPRQTTARERLASTFEQEFVAGQPMKLKLSQIVQQAEEQTPFQVAEWGVQCLDLMEAMPEMVAVLAKTNLPEEARQAAEIGLRNWLALNSTQGELMLAEMKNYFFDETPDTIYRLLWGYRPAEASDAEVAKQLVAWLDHDNMVVRELAFYWAKTLSGGRDYGYRPFVESKQERSSAVGRWKDHINNTGALAK